MKKNIRILPNKKFTEYLNQEQQKTIFQNIKEENYTIDEGNGNYWISYGGLDMSAIFKVVYSKGTRIALKFIEVIG